MAVSSAMVATIDPGWTGRSAVQYNKYKSGPRTLSYGTPALIGRMADLASPWAT